MYCANCGVKLADTEQTCPLCGTRAYHPDLTRTAGEELYPRQTKPIEVTGNLWTQGILTILWLAPMLIVWLCDRQLSGTVTWSGYVIGALLLIYIIAILPTWFKHPNPVIFVPCDFAAVALYLLYIDLATGGGWFLPFALPVTGGIALIVTATVTLLHYLRRGQLYIFGGAFVALGSFMLLVEYLLTATFNYTKGAGWSLYPLVVLSLLGGLLIFLGICRPARLAMERKFFI